MIINVLLNFTIIIIWLRIRKPRRCCYKESLGMGLINSTSLWINQIRVKSGAHQPFHQRAVSFSFQQVRVKSTRFNKWVYKIFFASLSKVSIDVWHQRLGHPSNKVLCQVFNGVHSTALDNWILDFCNACQYRKSHALPFQKSVFQAQQPLKLVASDL